MKKKTVIAGETSYVLDSLYMLIMLAFLTATCYFSARALENPYGMYIIELLPRISLFVFGIPSAIYFIKMLTEWQFATFSEQGVSFRSVLFSLGRIKWDELVAVRYQSIEIKVIHRRRRYRWVEYRPRIFVVLQSKDYRRGPCVKLNSKYGEYLRVLPESADVTVCEFLEKYRPDLKIECYE
ncbi:MAG: hypothetical protein IKZ05_03080 [Clostridia bacterium]|nr:hypothetical protein [Clostridia bacterium]